MIQYDARFGTPSDEVLRKLELSRMEVESMEKRNLNCPICGFRILGVFEGPINLAYFRRQHRHHRCIRFDKRKRNVTR